jgi:hypothetical protein
MKHIQDYLSPNDQPQEPQRSDERSPPGKSLIVLTGLWEAMTAAYGARWSSQYGALPTAPDNVLTPAAKMWAHGLQGMNLQRGVRAAIASGDEWPPTLPAFRELCKPGYEALGMPAAEVAYVQAAGGRWSAHGAVYAAALAVGVWELRTQPTPRTKPRFVAEYAKIAERVAAGEVFDPPPPRAALEHTPVATEATRVAALAAIKDTLRRAGRAATDECARDYEREQAEAVGAEQDWGY